MADKASPPKTGRTLGPRIVRTWFDTVVNPLLTALRRESQLLQERNWSWRYQVAGLQSIRSVRSYIEPEYVENLNQFFSIYKTAAPIVESHDDLVDVLASECSKLQQVLEANQGLRDLYARVTARDAVAALETDLEVLFGGVPEPERLALLVQYVINRTETLPEYYSTARLWNRYAKDFTSMLDDPEVQPQYRRVIALGQRLNVKTQSLIRLLEAIRLKLSLDHDVPYVTASNRRIDLE